jgi:hypothetical protein
MLITLIAFTKRMFMAVLMVTAASASFALPADSASASREWIAEFTCNNVQQNVELKWKTLSETKGIVLVEIQRSSDGNSFSTIGKIKISPQAISNIYSFTDHKPRRTTNCYRLKLHTSTGSALYSKVMIVELQKPASSAELVSITPDPGVNDMLVTVQMKEKGYINMVVTDSSNSIIIQNKLKAVAGLHTYKLENTGKLKRGSYFLNVAVNGEPSLLAKLEKN